MLLHRLCFTKFVSTFIQVLELMVKDSHLTGRTDVGRARFSLQDLGPDGKMSGWLKLDPIGATGPHGQPPGEMLVEIAYKVCGCLH